MIQHRWDTTPEEAIALQKQLAASVIHDAPLDVSAITHVAGVDVHTKGQWGRAAITVLSFPALEVVEVVKAEGDIAYPYITGLLSFREIPLILQAHAKLNLQPDAYLVDGQGRIHPRRLGIASHLGLWIDRPTIGVGKTYLLGKYEAPGPEKGAWSLITHYGEPIGAALRTRANVSYVYVSVGHQADLPSAIDLVIRCSSRYRLPDPTRQAHLAAAQP